MNQKTKQRWFALSSLVITFLLIRVFQDDFALAIKSDQPLEAGVQSVRYRFAKWNYHLNDFLRIEEANVATYRKKDYSAEKKTMGKVSFYVSRYGYINYREKLVIPPIMDVPMKVNREHLASKFNGKSGMFNQSGEIIIPFVYDRLEFNRHTQYIEASRDGKQGIINRQGKVVVPLEYDELSFVPSNLHYKQYLLATKGDRQEVIDLNNNKVAPFKVERIIAQKPDITIVEQEGVIGFMNGKEFTPFTVDEYGNYFTEGVAIVHHLDSYGRSDTSKHSYCVVDRQSKILVSANTDNLVVNERIDNLCRHLAKAKKLPILNEHSTKEKELGKLRPILINDKYGYMDDQQQLVIAPQFEKIELIAGGFSIVETGSLTGIITPAGRYIPLPTKENGEYQINEVTLVGYPDHYSDRYCIIDRAGNFLLSTADSNSSRPDKFKKIDNICRNLIGIEANNELVETPDDLPPSVNLDEKPYEYYFKEDLLLAIVNSKRGYVNRQGELAFLQLFDYADNFSEGLAAVQIDDQFGFIDLSGEMVLPGKDYFPFSQYTSIEKCRKYDYFGTLSAFENGLAVVSKIDNIDGQNINCEVTDKAKYYYLNKKNHIVAGDLIYSSFFEAKKVENDLIQTTIKVENYAGDGYDYRYGLMRTDGEIVTQHQSELPNPDHLQ